VAQAQVALRRPREASATLVSALRTLDPRAPTALDDAAALRLQLAAIHHELHEHDRACALLAPLLRMPSSSSSAAAAQQLSARLDRSKGL
jgi:TolA-binding protein